MEPQRIAYVLKIFPKLSETFVANELAELRRRGMEVRILSLLPPREELRHEIISRAGLANLVVCGSERFSSLIDEFRPQLLHAHFATESTAAARELAVKHHLPFTFTAHGYDIHRKPPSDFAQRAAAASAIVTVSEANADYIAETFRVLRSRIRVIPCGVDTDRFRPGARQDERTDDPDAGSRAGWLHRPLLILCVARQVKVKNLGLLLEACALLRLRGVAFRCVLLGDGPLRGEMETLRTRLGLETVVEMPGADTQDAVLKWWQRAAVGVLSSDNEGMPVCLMEAAACGVPVVATAVGGVPELVADGVTGLLTAAGDAAGFASALERLLSDEQLRARLGVAARRRAEERFSVTRQVDNLVQLWSEILEQARAHTSSTNSLAVAPEERRRRNARSKVPVLDPFGAAFDPELLSLAAALDPFRVREAFKRGFPRLTATGFVIPKSIRVIRYKPGRRAVVEYDVRVAEGDAPRQKLKLIGKVRAHRSGNEGYRQLNTIWQAGFDKQSTDGVCVPEPVGVIAEFRMWFQRRVRGQTAAELLSGADGVALARRIAEAIYKLHRANVPTDRVHGMADELRILRESLAKVVEQRPHWASRIERVLEASEELGASVSRTAVCGIHRDFYPAQVLVQEERLYLIDFDLYCAGDPALDVGNFLGHMIEQGLRESGRADALVSEQHALEERFVELSGEARRRAIDAYTTLTLARHIYLSTQFPERQKFTEALLELCEQRLYCPRTR